MFLVELHLAVVLDVNLDDRFELLSDKTCEINTKGRFTEKNRMIHL